MARAKRLRTDVINSPLGFRIHVLHYEDGAVGIRIGQKPMVIEQAFLTGSADGNTILYLTKKSK